MPDTKAVVPPADAGASPDQDRDAGQQPDASMPGATAQCGDGIASGVEKCDVGIAQGEPGACPTTCPMLIPCVPRVLNGMGCQAECILIALTCESGDGCCPGKCTRDNDRDCSGLCGDGIVQESIGETCEQDTDRPCPMGCDDGDGCTSDRLVGSAATCNVECLHDRIQTIGLDDKCCPQGANANTDPNCSPRCGNGIMEQGEDCDGGSSCDASCKLVDASLRNKCMQDARTDCERCACEKCTETELACRAGPNANENRLCSDSLSCSQQNMCLGTPCYCGDSPDCTLPTGPCRVQIEAAGGNALQVAQQVGDPKTIVGRFYAADQCRVIQCEAQCRP